MKSAGFIHLHNHSDYSLLDGMLKFADDKGHPSEFLKSLAAKKIPAVAVTDHGNMYGAVEFYMAASEMGIRPIIGCEVYITKGSRTDRTPKSREDTSHLTLLAKDSEGYQNLMLLVSKGFTEGFYYDPRIDKDLLSKHHEGLIALSGCINSHVAIPCLENNIELACRQAAEYRDIMGNDNFYIELMDHGLEDEKKAIPGLLEVSKRTSIPAVATNDCHYPHKEDWEAHDAHICISTGSFIDDPKRLKFGSNEFYFKSPEEMIKLFSYMPKAVSNTIDIAERCHVKIATDKLFLPHFDVPGNFRGLTVDEYLEKRCHDGLKIKLGGDIAANYAERLKYELSVIKKMGFSSYFLIVEDFINQARKMDVPVGPGRGSGAGALVAYSLDITKIDPLAHGLLFERFLNPDRKTMPDLDIDFSDDGRSKVIDYVKEKYGAGNVAQIITFGTIKARSAIKDVGRVMGFQIAEVDKLAKMFPSVQDITVYKALHSIPELKEAAKDPKVKKLFELAQKIEGLKRHTSVHAAGTVITKEAVLKYTPLANRNTKNIVTTQYQGETLTKLGLLKIDFLGLRTLTVIKHTIELVRRRSNPALDIEKIPLDDAKTFDLLCSAKTMGIFQLESDGMRELIRNLKPSIFSDISALVALYRPGPMQSGMLDLFVERKHGKQKIVYDHPMMEPVLKDTYGTIVYQEQVMETAKRLGRFSPGEADSLRKAMGKKNPEEMEKMRSKFTSGCKENGIQQKLATKIFDQMAQFAGYGFNKSHSVAYALLSYQTAYLKANYPLEFMTALLTSEIGHSPIGAEDKENKLVTYLDDTKEMGINLLAPDAQTSFSNFAIEKETGGRESIRFALSAIKNIGTESVDAIVLARQKGGCFKSLPDFCRRIEQKHVNRKVIESLTKSGAMDSLYAGLKPEESRAKALAETEGIIEQENRVRQEVESGQGFLFDTGTAPAGHNPEAGGAAVEPMAEHTLLQFEKEVLGFYLSGHPLGKYRRQLTMAATHTIKEAVSGKVTGPARLAGMITQVKKMQTRKTNEQMARFELEDLTGTINAIVFSKKFALLSSKIAPNQIVAVLGNIKPSQLAGGPGGEIFAEDVLPLYDALSKWGRHFILTLPQSSVLEEKHLESLRKIFALHPGRCPVYFRVSTPKHGPVMVETGERVALCEQLTSDIEKTLGEKTWQIQSASL